MARGFVLQSGWHLEDGRPVVTLRGVLEGGGSFLVRDDRVSAGFWVARSSAEAVRRLGGVASGAPDRVAMDGSPLARVEAGSPSRARALAERLDAAGIAHFEADVRLPSRYLIDRGIRGTLAIEGVPRRGRGIDAVFHNPVVRPATFLPALSVLSIDLETDPARGRLLSAALVGDGVAEVLLVRPARSVRLPPGAHGFPDERALLAGLESRILALDPDVITGWNVIDFDLRTLERAARGCGVRFEIGRGPGPLRVLDPQAPRAPRRVDLPGRLALDGVQLLRSAFVVLESYALEHAARQLLGEGKTITGRDRVHRIVEAWEHDVERFVEYNRNDARLAFEIVRRLQLVELAVERSRLTGLPPDRVAASIAAFDFLYLSELSRRGIAAPTTAAGRGDEIEASGGHVLEPRPGLYRDVLVFDFKSLYPSIIRTFQIDPLGRLAADDASEPRPIVAPNGARFRRRPGILPAILDDLFPRREAAKATGDRIASQAIKILMNSFYGVLGTRACRFAAPELANAITGFGREILLWTKARIEARGLEVLYGDTDSLFVLAATGGAAGARELGLRLVRELNDELAEHVRATWDVASRLELAFDRLYLRLLLPHVRHGTAGARKRYAGAIDGGDPPQVLFTGMEVVRSDWTPLARRVQRELYERLFSDRPVDTYLHEIVADLRAGKLDAELVYRKRLRKPLASYVASTPPHVAAARKATGPPGNSVRYVITVAGPEPAEERRSALDREHYVRAQVRPVAEPVLDVLGLRFDRVVGDDAQLTLF